MWYHHKLGFDPCPLMVVFFMDVGKPLTYGKARKKADKRGMHLVRPLKFGPLPLPHHVYQRRCDPAWQRQP